MHHRQIIDSLHDFLEPVAVLVEAEISFVAVEIASVECAFLVVVRMNEKGICVFIF